MEPGPCSAFRVLVRAGPAPLGPRTRCRSELRAEQGGRGASPARSVAPLGRGPAGARLLLAFIAHFIEIFEENIILNKLLTAKAPRVFGCSAPAGAASASDRARDTCSALCVRSAGTRLPHKVAGRGCLGSTSPGVLSLIGDGASDPTRRRLPDTSEWSLPFGKRSAAESPADFTRCVLGPPDEGDGHTQPKEKSGRAVPARLRNAFGEPAPHVPRGGVTPRSPTSPGLGVLPRALVGDAGSRGNLR